MLFSLTFTHLHILGSHHATVRLLNQISADKRTVQVQNLIYLSIKTLYRLLKALHIYKDNYNNNYIKVHTI